MTSFAKVSDAELQEFFRMAKEEVDVNYLVVSPEKFLARENPAGRCGGPLLPGERGGISPAGPGPG